LLDNDGQYLFHVGNVASDQPFDKLCRLAFGAARPALRVAGAARLEFVF
jgi:hypothetical protein